MFSFSHCTQSLRLSLKRLSNIWCAGVRWLFPPHYCIYFYNVMFFWTNIPWSIFYSTGLLSIIAVLYIFKNHLNQTARVASYWTVEWIKWRLLICRISRMEIATVQYAWLQRSCASLPLGREGFTNACLVMVIYRSLSLRPTLLPPNFRYLGLPNDSNNPVLLVAPTLLTVFPPRKWVTISKHLWQIIVYIFKELQKNFSCIQVQAEKSERLRFHPCLYSLETHC